MHEEEDMNKRTTEYYTGVRTGDAYPAGKWRNIGPDDVYVVVWVMTAEYWT